MEPGNGHRSVFDEALLRAENNFGSEVVQRALCIVAVAGAILEIDLVDLLSQTANVSHGSWNRLAFALEPFLWMGNLGRASQNEIDQTGRRERSGFGGGVSRQDILKRSGSVHLNNNSLMQLTAHQLSFSRSLTLDTDTSDDTATPDVFPRQVGGTREVS